MNASIHEPATAERQRVVLERVFAAPRDLLFTLFTEPEHLKRWWCPYPLTFPVCEFEARPGAALNMVMETADGTRFSRLGTMIEVDPPDRLVFSEQQDMNASGVPETEVLQTITFTERGRETLVRVQIDVLRAGERTMQTLRGMDVGWMQDFGRLEFYLMSLADVRAGQHNASPAPVVTTPSDREIVLSRTFAAPREEVFKALTDPATIPQWWGIAGSTTTVETMNVCQDGRWRFLVHQPNGETVEFSGQYFLIDPPELAVYSFEVGLRQGGTPFDQLEIDAVHLIERDGRTLLTSISLFPSKDARDRALNAGIIDGAVNTYERLAHVLQASV
jgi:uncharacterized protein YndB with AHSA1/START domain